MGTISVHNRKPLLLLEARALAGLGYFNFIIYIENEQVFGAAAGDMFFSF